MFLILSQTSWSINTKITKSIQYYITIELNVFNFNRQFEYLPIDISMRKRANVPHRSIALRIAATRVRKNIVKPCLSSSKRKAEYLQSNLAAHTEAWKNVYL